MWKPEKDCVFMVGEIGINANGDIELVKKLIKKCHEAGFDCVKFQKRNVEVCYTPEELLIPRESPWGDTNGAQKHGLEFNLEDYKQIDDYCGSLGILWTASPWDESSVDFLMQFDLPYIKIASALVTDKSFLRYCIATKKPLWISTGMCHMEKIKKIVRYIFEHGDNLGMVYHCTSTYPTKIEELNLSAIKTMARSIAAPIGYSGHEPGVMPSVLAASLGAKSIERHVTLSRTMYGSDQAASLEPQGFTRLIRDVRDWESARGSGIPRLYDTEKPIAQKLRKVDDFEDQY